MLFILAISFFFSVWESFSLFLSSYGARKASVFHFRIGVMFIYMRENRIIVHCKEVFAFQNNIFHRNFIYQTINIIHLYNKVNIKSVDFVLSFKGMIISLILLCFCWDCYIYLNVDKIFVYKMMYFWMVEILYAPYLDKRYHNA